MNATRFAPIFTAGQEFHPYRAEFRGKILCAVDADGEVVIKGLLRHSGQKANYVQVVHALNVIYCRGIVASMGVRTAPEVVQAFLMKYLDEPKELIEMAATFIWDDLGIHLEDHKDLGSVLHYMAFLCKTSPHPIHEGLERARQMIELDEKPLVAKKQRPKSERVAKKQQQPETSVETAGV